MIYLGLRNTVLFITDIAKQTLSAGPLGEEHYQRAVEEKGGSLSQDQAVFAFESGI